jgi:hypothetical protein
MAMAYRDDVDALLSRQTHLEQDLARIAQSKRELQELTQDEQRIAAELEDVQRRLAERRKLPLLSDVRVASPCSADWNAMQGDERVRFCGACEKNVYNLSSMTAEEAERLIAEKEGDLCVRYHQRADGTVLTEDCPVGKRRRRVRRVLSAVGAGVVVTAGAAWYVAEMAVMGGLRPPPARQDGRWVMGEAAAFDDPQMATPPAKATPGEEKGKAPSAQDDAKAPSRNSTAKAKPAGAR